MPLKKLLIGYPYPYEKPPADLNEAFHKLFTSLSQMELFISFLHKLFICAEPKKEPTFLCRINFPIGLYYLQLSVGTPTLPT